MTILASCSYSQLVFALIFSLCGYYLVGLKPSLENVAIYCATIIITTLAAESYVVMVRQCVCMYVCVRVRVCVCVCACVAYVYMFVFGVVHVWFWCTHACTWIDSRTAAVSELYVMMVCVCVCPYVYACVHIDCLKHGAATQQYISILCTCLRNRTVARVHLCVSCHLCACVCVRACVHMHTFECYIHVESCIKNIMAHTSIWANMYTYTHLCVHTHTNKNIIHRHAYV
jgi:hypothetical protein